jgi:hypothetical protein
MCFAAFSVVTVQYKNIGVFIIKKTVLWYVRLCSPEDVNPHAACILRV